MPAETAVIRTQDTPIGVLHVAQPVVVLDEQQAHGAPGSSGRVVIHADTVVVRGRYRLPGRAVQIIARRIESENGTLDVSGSPAAGFDPQKAEESLNGTQGDTPARADAKDGAPGDDGHDGGRLEIVVGELVGGLHLAANGSAGGSGQRGGDGAKPKAGRDGEDGAFTAHEPPAGKFGAYVVRGYGSRWYWEMAHGEKGAAAPTGGRAGAPGKAGNGGCGGRIELSYLAVPATPPTAEAAGAAGGTVGVPGTPGPAGEPGKGGRNRLYEYHWPAHHSEHFADEANGDVSEIVARFGLALRAGHEAGGGPGAVATLPPAPVAGATGTTTVGPLAATDLHFKVDLDYLEFVLAIAEEAAHAGDHERALERYRWLERLTPETPARSERRYALRQKAQAGMQALQASGQPPVAADAAAPPVAAPLRSRPAAVLAGL